jgi:hypothetical protein
VDAKRDHPFHRRAAHHDQSASGKEYKPQPTHVRAIGTLVPQVTVPRVTVGKSPIPQPSAKTIAVGSELRIATKHRTPTPRK